MHPTKNNNKKRSIFRLSLGQHPSREAQCDMKQVRQVEKQRSTMFTSFASAESAGGASSPGAESGRRF